MQRQTTIALCVACLWPRPALGSIASEERHPTYFVSGAEDAKIQFSRQQELLDKSSLYFAYTLQGLWLREVPSTPFKELLHRPELYVASAWGDFGYEHLSNGLDNRSTDHEGTRKRSRSLQRLYWQDLSLLQWGAFQAGLKLMAPVFIKKPSPYHNYLGYEELVLTHVTPSTAFSLRGGVGSQGGHLVAGVSVNPLLGLGPAWASRNRTWLFAEYFHGHAETLMEYDRQTSAFRLGLRLIL